MASEEQANRARKKHGSALMRQGVHAIEVTEGESHGKNGWVVLAHVSPRQDVALPSSLPLSTASGEVDVPLVVKHSEPFKPE